jgi:fumarate hydratase class II
VENFPIGAGLRMPLELIHALVLVKRCAAEVNHRLGLLDHSRFEAIAAAAGDVLAGGLDGQFVLSIFQTGSGTSTHMNVNEVLASRANEIITGQKGGKSPVHPNDHVNLGQSSNDVIPSAIHMRR